MSHKLARVSASSSINNTQKEWLAATNRPVGQVEDKVILEQPESIGKSKVGLTFSSIEDWPGRVALQHRVGRGIKGETPVSFQLGGP